MNVVEFKSRNNLIAFCFIDNTHRYKSAWTREVIKNIADYTISNLTAKGYSVYQSENEDSALNRVTDLGYKYAVVFSTGTEFINGDNFFTEINRLIENDFYIYGHILDRGDAYYELHHQCYLISLDKYRSLGCPVIGQTDLGNSHRQQIPDRSLENIHDDYTPLWINSGTIKRNYNHKLHGWNIISAILNAGGAIVAFDESIRANKKHYYPENQSEFLKHISWAHARYHYCANEFVHTENTEVIGSIATDYEQIITPASGIWFKNYISKSHPVTVVYYDYNQQSLDYWKLNAPIIDNVTYKFVKVDLLGIYNLEDLIADTDKKTLINLSNIFCYEGTAMFASLEYRLQKEKELRDAIPKHWTTIIITSSISGFTNSGNDLKITKLIKPTWHIGGDWNE
jgi:hypothetical protein